MIPDVTVIVPVYNPGPYLSDCLASLIGQSGEPGRLEVVAVDDGSTDGSGEALDRVAGEHPELFTVLHQQNSGGPANPCNVGLEVANGRYVFFLGSDDYLDQEAVERMVSAADAWESDVLCCRLVGVGGRFVSQKLYQETTPEVAFPSELLASALSNTKLFRRSLIEEHAIRYPESLKVGSDQPFTLKAMVHARRISVLADRPYYYAVKRRGAENLTYTSTWDTRLRDLGAVVRGAAELLPEGAGRDSVLMRHFAGELAVLLRRDFPEISEAEQRELVAGVNDLGLLYLTDAIVARLQPMARVRYRLAAQNDLAGLRHLTGAEEGPHVVHLDGHGVHRAPKILAHRVADPEFDVPGDRRKQALDVFGTATLTFEGGVMNGVVPTTLTPESASHVQTVLVKTVKRSGWGRRLQDGREHSAPRAVPVTIEGGLMRWQMDLATLPRIRPGKLDCLRVDLATAEGRYRVPLHAATTPSSRFHRGDLSLTVQVSLDHQNRALLEIGRSS